MARIPTVTNQVGANALRSSGVMPNTRASAAAFGGTIGQALQGVAGGVEDLAGGLDAMANRKRQETVANRVAQSDFTARELAIRNEIPADGSGYQKRVLDDYDAFVNEQADSIEDNVARTEYKNRMLSQRPALSSRSAQYEFTLQATNAKEQANASVMALTNKIMTDPTMYETYVTQGIDVIDTRHDVSAAIKEGMKQTWRQDSARARFTGMLERATSVDDIDAIANELAGKGQDAAGPDERPTDWTKQFSPQDYERMVNTIGNTRKAFITKADTDARAAIDTIEERAKDVNALIPQEELAQVQRIVRQSQNPITISRMARITRDQSIIQESRNLTPSELRSRINAANGNPNTAYPGMPPQLSNAINDATGKFDVSASYLGGTIQREYGQYLRGGSAKGKPQFRPTAIHNGVDLRNVRSDVVDAATVAGELFGRPLPITSGYRSQARQDSIRANGDPNRVTVAKESKHTDASALDISTADMSDEDQARLVGSLVDAGFTGIGQYGTHIHADFRAAVPASFGKDDAWGGWTNLSPGVMAELKKRGFAPGISSEQIQRANAVPMAGTDIDYGRGTALTKDDGRPASSAVGVMQFTDGTFLQTMRTDGVAARIGVDISNMSDAQIVELRKDPYIATMAGAALGEANKRTMTAALGRPVSDPELYMAHFLGAGGATTLISGLKNQPQQSAAKLLPAAAAANRPVFYDKNGRERTVEEVYGNIATQFGTAPSQVAHGDNQTRQRVLDNAETQIKNDPMAYGSQTGTFTYSGLQDDTGAFTGFAARGRDARSVADYYSIPAQDMKPFTNDEAASLSKAMKDGNADDVLALMTAMQAMGGDMARAGYKQLDQKDSVYAYAAGLQYDAGQGAVAADIVRGQKRIEENPDIKNGVGAQPSELYDAFTKATGGALFEVSPKMRQSIQDAALAHYVETTVARGTSTGFDQDAFANSVQAVMGGAQGAPAIDTVNGQPTVLPRGVTGATMERAFQRMTVDDWALMSDQKLPPRYVTGEIMSPDDLADEATLRAIGGGKYRIMLGDGSFAVTGRASQNGRVEAYIFTPDPKQINKIATRPASVNATQGSPVPRDELLSDDNAMSVEEQRRLRENYGVLYQFDENGRWIGPAKK